MPMTVAELLAEPHLGLEVLVPGDTARPIRWVHTTELVDPSRYLQGGEVILTTGVWEAAGTSARAFVRPLAKKGIAALGYGIGTPGGGVPAPLVAACRRARVLLFSVPFELPFIAISQAFVERMTREREAALAAAVQRNDQLVRVVERGLGLRGILAVLERNGVRGAWLVGAGGRVLAAVRGAPDAARARAVWRAANGVTGGEWAGEWVTFPIVSVGRTEAHLAVEGPPQGLDGATRSAIDQALPFLALELARRRALRESERRFAAELIDLVMAGASQLDAASARLEAFGLPARAPLAAFVCATHAPESALDAVETALAEADVPSVVAVKGAELVAVVRWERPEAELTELARTIRDAAADGAAVGAGGRAEGASGLRTSILEARQACRFAQLRRSGAGYATHHEVGSHTLLLALQDEAVLEAFRRALLRPLDEHDARRHSRLVETLDAFLSSGCQWQATARALHVHVNTLRHRLSRVEQLTGRDLSSMEDRVDFFIALRSRP